MARFARIRRSRDDDAAPTEATDAVAEPSGEHDAAPAEASQSPDEAPTEIVGADGATRDEGEPGDAGATAATEIAVVDGGEREPEPEPEGPPGFIARGRLRRRLRYVRRAREIALRDLGGLVFDLHRFGRDRGDLVEQKLAALTALDAEMRELEALLDARQEVTVLREPGLAGCPRCGALVASDASYCSSCGLPLARGASLPAGPTPAGAAEHRRPADPPDAPPPAAAPDEPPTPVS